MNKTGKEKIERAERIAFALRMRVAGKGAPEIAAALGVAKSTVYQYIRDGIAEIIREPAEEVIALELTRLDKLLTGYWAEATTGDVKAGTMVLKIMERRAKLTGIDLYAAQKALSEGREPAAVDKWLDHMMGKAVEDAV